MGKHIKYPVGSYGWQKRQGGKNVRHYNGVRIPEFSDRQFAAVDGEGGTVWGPVLPDSPAPPGHHYYLLRTGEQELFNPPSAGPLTARQCFDYVTALPPDRIYVAFAFGYDVTMMVRTLPKSKLERLMARAARTRVIGKKLHTYAVDWDEYQLDYMPGKEFKVRKQLDWDRVNDSRRLRRDTAVWTPWFTIHDVFSFFQCSFVAALELWFPTEHQGAIAKIKEGKDLRAAFTGLDDYIREYCHLECNMLVLLMDRFRDNAYGAGIRPTRWQGPGNLVEAVMKREGFPKSRDVPMWDTVKGTATAQGWNIKEMGNAAYYGGRFEAPIIGDIQGPVYQADINSAYASIYRDLPCLNHGIWHSVGSSPDLDSDGSLSIREYHFTHNDTVRLCGLPVRTITGTIIYPRSGNGIYWSHEIRAASPFLDSVRLGTGYIYEKACDCNPFDWIYRIYDHRKEVGKNSGMGLIDKLVLASTYGKLCQSVGSAPYANPVWASLVTSLIRTQLYNAAMMNGDGSDVVMLATDGLFTLGKRPLHYGTSLGEWELTCHDSMFSVQSGVYLLPTKEPKSRGVSRKVVAARESDLRECWKSAIELKEPYNASITVDLHSFNGLGLCVARGKPEQSGQWVDIQRDLGFEWRNKRNATGWEVVDSYIRTTPLDGNCYDRNIPYRETIGGVLLSEVEYPTLERERDAEQPDWNFHNVGYGIRE